MAATVLVAGMFAFMPVEKASTVHTAIQSGVGVKQVLQHTHTDVVGDGLVTVDCGRDASN